MPTKTEAKTRIETTRTRMRRGRHAYIGLYGLAYDRFQMRREQAKALTENLFEDLAEKGETTVKQAEILVKHAQKSVWENYAGATDKLTDALPIKIKSRVELLEDELKALQATFDRLSETAATEAKKAKKTATKKVKTVKAKTEKVVAETIETVVETSEAVVETAKEAIAEAATPVVETVVEAAAIAASAPASPAKSENVKTPRHIPYYNDVKRYDPLANEDVVRKIVNHCGIALRSEDARYVACSDESERVTVRESWLKRKLNLTALDADLDKKVFEVCDLMQRDQKKNRVTFYYLLAKKERLLDSL